jgi:ribosome biogenesis GTPase
LKIKKSEDQHPGEVVAYFGDKVEVETKEGNIIVCYLRRSNATPVAGDQVMWQYENDNKGVVTQILDRRSLLVKPDYRGKLKPIAANIDAIIIVMAPPPVFSEYLIDRYAIAAELLKIQPILLLNKVDLLTEEHREETMARLEPYQKMGYSVILMSAKQKHGLDDLLLALKQKTGVLVGPSGVGKSSIINAILMNQEIRIGDLSASGAGKHTTTTVRLYHLPEGGNLIDSPGIRDFNLWAVSKEEINKGFIEFHPFAGKCRFRNCGHKSEPECAVLQAVAEGDISAARLQSYRELMRECEERRKY